MSYNQRLLIDLLKEHQMLSLSRIFLVFSIIAIKPCRVLHFCENRTEIMIRHFCHLVYLVINDTLIYFDSFFSKTGLTSASFNWSGNFPSIMHLLKFCKIKLANVSTLSLILLKEISSDCFDFEVSKLLVSFRISS